MTSWAARFGSVRAYVQAPQGAGAARLAAQALHELYVEDPVRCAQEVWPYVLDPEHDEDDLSQEQPMTPEQRERIEDVKLWVRATLEADVTALVALDELARGGMASGTSYAPPTVYESAAGSLQVSASPLSWQFHYEDFWGLVETHRAAIYSALKAWRKAQEGA